MNWFRQNRWLGSFLVTFGVATIFALWFLFSARSNFADALTQFREAATERSRLEHLNPFPNEENFRKTQTALENYAASLEKLREELRAEVFPISALAPNEFQSRLRQAILAATERARTNRVKLPENFHLGFDEFTTTLPNASAAPQLGQELAEIELLVNILIDARIDAIVSLKRGSPPAESPALTTPPRKTTAVTERELVQRAIIDFAFTASPSAMRKVVNQIASSENQFFIIRTLSVRKIGRAHV